MVFVQFPDVMPGVPASYGNEEEAKSSNKDQVRQKLIALCLGQSLVKQIKNTALSMWQTQVKLKKWPSDQ